MRSLLEKVNKFCIWTFKKNIIKTAGSRKTDFFRGKTVCSKSERPCVANIIIDKKDSNILQVTFTGDIKHDVTKPMSERDTTGTRKSQYKVFLGKTRVYHLGKFSEEIYNQFLEMFMLQVIDPMQVA